MYFVLSAHESSTTIIPAALYFILLSFYSVLWKSTNVRPAAWKIHQFKTLAINISYVLVSWTCSTVIPWRCNLEPPTGGGGVTPLYKPYRYVPPHRVGFLHRFGLKTGLIHFAILVWNQVWFSRELRECMNPFFQFNSKWVRKKEKYANSIWIWRIFFLFSRLYSK